MAVALSLLISIDYSITSASFSVRAATAAATATVSTSLPTSDEATPQRWSSAGEASGYSNTFNGTLQGQPLPLGEVGSEAEDRLLEVVRQVDARVEEVLGALTGGVPRLLAGAEEVTEGTAQVSAEREAGAWDRFRINDEYISRYERLTSR